MQALLLRISVAALILIAAYAQQAPERFQVEFSTTVANGATFVIEARREYAPLGVDRFYELVNDAYYDANGFFRVLPGFVVQWGISGDPAVTAKWENQNINDDPVRMSNVQGTVAFATSGPNTRTTQLYINYADNKRLDGLGFSVFGFVVAGFDVVQKIYAGYREQPDQDQLSRYGNAYLKQYFPKLDYIIQARVISEGDARQMITRSPSQASDRQLQLQLQQQQLLARQQQQQQQLQQQQQQQEQGQEGQQDDEQSGQQQEAQQQEAQQQEQGPADEGQQENDNGSDRPPGPPGLPSNEPAQSQPHSDHILSLDEATQEANRAMERLTGHLRSMGLEEALPRPSKEEQIAQSEETDRELDEKVKALSELHEQIRQKKAELEARSRELEEGKSAVDKLKSSFDASSRLEALLKSMKQQE